MNKPPGTGAVKGPVIAACLLAALSMSMAVRGDAGPAGAAPVASPGDTTYRVDPVNGDDANPAGEPWKTYGKLNSIRLAPGDRVIVAPGIQNETLMPAGEGTPDKPITIQFLPGVHTITSKHVKRLPIFVSNSQDTTDPKPVGILVRNCKPEGRPLPPLPDATRLGRAGANRGKRAGSRRAQGPAGLPRRR